MTLLRMDCNHIPALSKAKHFSKIWPYDPSNFTKFHPNYEYRRYILYTHSLGMLVRICNSDTTLTYNV